MSTFFKDMIRGYGRSSILSLIAPLIVLPAFCLFILLPLWLVNSQGMPFWILILGGLLFLAVVFGTPFAFTAWTVSRRASMLNAIFEPLGLSGKAYMTFFRQYHGTIQGRQVDAYFRRGPVLEVDVSTPLQTRLGITGPQTDTRVFANLAGQQPLELSDPALGDLTIFALDEAWARALLANPYAVDLLHQLTALNSFFTRQQIILRPGAIRLMCSGNRNMFRTDLDAEQVRGWINDLLRLIAIAEHLPTPQVIVEESSAERMAASLRKRNPYLALWVGLGMAVFFLACSGVVVTIVFVLIQLE